ncbi:MULTISPECIES: lysophospholipid acyltransferase family protein [Roseobacteraceae]|jgi:KDO2-lipid IV(A) lauroyltransferase|nr:MULTISPECIES: lysophospholipid acyltransferase family protein [Roseobacteraceae]
MPKADPSTMPLRERAGHYISNAIIYTLIRVALVLPYATRVALLGGLVERVVGPLVGYRRRAEANLALIFPEMPTLERRRIARACLNNAGRSIIENYSSQEFLKRMDSQPISGAGFDALREADAADRPVILVTGHFGNYEATRAALVAQGFAVGGLYRDMANPYFNAHYVKTMQAFGGPVFPQGRRGTSGFVRHLRGGGQLVLLFDQHVFEGTVLDFMGQPAKTALSAAELALRFNALLIPFYGIRQDDGLSFETVLEAPIAHSDPETMTQALNDSLAVRVREHPEQWFWVHRRWRAYNA